MSYAIANSVLSVAVDGGIVRRASSLLVDFSTMNHVVLYRSGVDVYYGYLA